MRLLSVAVAGLLSLSVLTSCSSSDNTEGAERLAVDLATGLSKKDLVDLPTSEGVDLPTVLGDLDDTPVTVSAGEVTVVEQEGRASVPLTWSWPLGEDRTWSYATEARLVESSALGELGSVPETDDYDGWAVAWAPSVVEPSLVEGETLAVTTQPATRGRILGADGTVLVRPRPVVRYGLDKTRVPAARQATSARRVARALGIEVAPYVRAVAAAGPRAFVEGIVLRESDGDRVPTSYADIPGAGAVAGTLPLAPTKEFAAPILGGVGPATAEIVEKSAGAVGAGDEVGLSGLQLRYDEQLRGTPGRTVAAIAADGSARELFSADAVAGQPLTLTLDEALQLEAEQILATVGGDNASAIVAVRPSTGAVLAAANGPGTGGQNVATFGQYAPGSTFKVVSALALLRSGLTPSSTVSCPPTTVVDGKTFKNYDDYPASGLGSISFGQAVANSCNTAFIGQRDRLAGADLADAAAALGVGVDYDTGFPSYFGQVPAPASETEAAADLIGQGKVLASPMTMAAVAASVASGRTVVPHLVDGAEPTASPPVPLTPGEAGALRGLMRGVVTSGSGSLLAGLSGQVGAKTGTAEYGTPVDGALPTHAWMIAFRGDLAVAVFVEDGASGSRTAGPLLLRFLS